MTLQELDDYVYSGTCHYTIKGKKMTLNQGDVSVFFRTASGFLCDAA